MTFPLFVLYLVYEQLMFKARKSNNIARELRGQICNLTQVSQTGIGAVTIGKI